MDKIANIVIEYTIDEHNRLKVDGFVTRASADKMAVYYLELLEAENRADDEVNTATLSDLNTEADPFKNANNPS